MRRALITVVLLLLLVTAPATALEVQVKEVKSGSAMLHASLELRDILPERFKRLLDENGSLHLRLQAELWEIRPVWDRLVYPAVVRAVRMTRDSLPASPRAVTLELGHTDRLVATSRYYVHAVATLGTLADRDADEVGDVVFGRESETNSLGSLGRLVFRTALKISDYLQSVSAETKSRRISGSDLLKP